MGEKLKITSNLDIEVRKELIRSRVAGLLSLMDLQQHISVTSSNDFYNNIKLPHCDRIHLIKLKTISKKL